MLLKNPAIKRRLSVLWFDLNVRMKSFSIA
jgi:hypothetical protein